MERPLKQFEDDRKAAVKIAARLLLASATTTPRVGGVGECTVQIIDDGCDIEELCQAVEDMAGDNESWHFFKRDAMIMRDADALLLHDRPILNRLDDSLARLALGQPQLLRHNGGYIFSTLQGDMGWPANFPGNSKAGSGLSRSFSGPAHIINEVMHLNHISTGIKPGNRGGHILIDHRSPCCCIHERPNAAGELIFRYEAHREYEGIAGDIALLMKERLSPAVNRSNGDSAKCLFAVDESDCMGEK